MDNKRLTTILYPQIRTRQSREYEEEIHYILVGSSHILRYPLNLFPRGHVASTSSFECLATNFHSKNTIRYAINKKPDVIITMMGSNDIALIKKITSREITIGQQYNRSDKRNSKENP